MSFHRAYFLATFILIPGILLARSVSTALPWFFLRRWHRFDDGALPILIWGGLRGALSVAMALSLPAGDTRDTIVAITYGIVVFSILVQGTTLRSLITWRFDKPGSPPT